MKIVIKFASEIIVKSRAVRILFIKVLARNIKIVLQKYCKSVDIVRHWDYLEIKYEYNNSDTEIFQILANIPGIHHFVLVQDSIIESLEDIYQQIMLTDYPTELVGKKFCIRVKRYGNHVVSSQDIARYIGSRLCSAIHHIKVNLINPDVTISLNIKDNRLFIIIQRCEGLGGLPIGTQKESLSLVSGGFDSIISSYMLIRRGCKVNYCFFNLMGDVTSVVEIYKIVHYLWSKYSSSHNVRLVSIDFTEIIKEISIKITNKYTGIILKRMMFRAASFIASRWKIKTLVTGEVLGQVSSQTLDNLISINNIVPTNCIVLRPLIVYDKESIIALSRHIGTEYLSKSIPEYCGMISKKSSIKISTECIELEENKFDFAILNKAICQFDVIDVRKIPKFIVHKNMFNIETKTVLNDQDIVLDIRTEYEQKKNPISVPLYTVIKKIPFYKLIDIFPRLDQNKVYLLYCGRGIMSRLQAMHLHQKGFKNVKIYRSILN